MAELVNRFSYSLSQGNQFRTCERQYWFSRYGSWGGWEKDALPLSREAYRLKKLTNRYLWTGNRVHETIRHTLDLLRSGSQPDPVGTRDRLLEQLRQDFRGSRDHPRKTPGPKNKVLLLEHEDPDSGVSDTQWKGVVDRALSAIDGFFRSEAFRLIQKTGYASLLRNDDVLESMDSAVEGFVFPVYVTIDVALDTPEGILILDWKTGKPDASGSHEEQLGIYALFSKKKWATDPGRIRFSPVYLSYAPERLDLSPVTEGMLDLATENIRTNAGKILQKIDDPERGVARMENFRTTEDPSECRRCVYRTLCSDSPLKTATTFP
ncbi:MAG: PD-(D/E)XK nuclease family protein [Nitrospirae bacterium]|jgi:hypothetical protein|nr:PD-(D/E)XK nuclease family protein [Nitrospirota bacterium]